MKNAIKLFGNLNIIALTALIGLSIAACRGDGINYAAPLPRTATYISTDTEGNTYTLSITEDLSRAVSSRAVYVGKTGDHYVLEIRLTNGKVETSRGTVVSVSAQGVNLQPSNASSAAESFTADVSSGKLLSISGTIKFEDNTEKKVTTPITTTPSGVGEKTKLEGIWRNDTWGSQPVRFVFSGTYFVQQFLVNQLWENEADSTFTLNDSSFTLADDGKGKPLTISYTLSGTTLTFPDYSLVLTKQ